MIQPTKLTLITCAVILQRGVGISQIKMANESLQVLWRGGDLAKFSALQSALHNEGIKFYDVPIYDPAGGFLQSKPYYLDAMPGFEIRVLPEDFGRALSALQWVESKEGEVPPTGGSSSHEQASRGSSSDAWAPRSQDPYELQAMMPTDWNVKEATAEVWSGEDDLMADYLGSVLAENGIPSNIPDETSLKMRLCVRPIDLMRARALVRGIVSEE
jgi:hypothetical protein